MVETLTAAAGFKPRSLDYSSSRDEDEGPTLVDRLGQPDPGISFIEDRDALRAQLETLPARESRIIVLRFFECLTQSEIADQMGISQMHVSRLLTQSLQRLREGMLDRPHTKAA